MKTVKLFSASWCGPCHMLKSRLKSAKIEVEIVSVDDNREEVIKYKVRSIPTLIVEEGDNFEAITGMDDIFNYLKDEQNSKV